MRLKSVKFIATVILLILGTIIIITFSGFSFINTKVSLENKYINESELVLAHTMLTFQNQFDSVDRAIKLLAKIKQINGTKVLSEDENLQSQLEIIQKMSPDGSSLQIGKEDGGIIMMPEMQIPLSYDPRERNWYRFAVKNEGKIIWTEPYLDYMTQRIVITAAETVFTLSGKIDGVVAVNFDVSSISELISHSRIGSSGFVMLLSKNGTIIANRDNFMVGEKIFDDYFEIMMSHKNTNDLQYKINGIQYYLYMDTIKENGMVLVAGVNKNEIDDNLIRTLLPQLISGLVYLLIFGFVAYFSALKGIVPLERLVLLMKQAETGDYSVNAEIQNYVEINSLSKSFNNMITGIRKRDEELRHQYYELENSQKVLQKSEEKIKHMAFYDSLTGLSNRVRLTDALNSDLAKINEGSARGAVFYIDLDNFKSINDTMGHSIGDKVLIQIANRLDTIDCYEKIVARIGGDEFVILFYNITSIDKIRDISKYTINVFNDPVLIDTKSFSITASIGIALYPEHGITTEELFKKADMAMYRAKGKGKSCFQIFDESMQKEVLKKVNFENELRYALKKGELSLVYQPLYSLKDHRIKSFETLLRWTSPSLGTVSPLAFIRTAEKIGLIVTIENWVLKNACMFAKEINQGLQEPIKFSVNISPVHIMHRNFVNHIQDTISQCGVDPSLIELEITETVMMESFQSNMKKLDKLRKFGMGIHLDDFGSGYSSLNYLQKLPIDYVKIDKVFIDNMVNSSKESKITLIIVELAHNLGLQVVAEGVESKEQFDMLLEHNCDIVQGYYISRPLPGNKVIEFLRYKAQY